MELVIYDTNSELIEKLKHCSRFVPFVDCQVGYGPEVTARASLDAMWASLMVGVEIFGANPPFPLHEARVFSTPEKRKELGMPRYGIVGVAVADDDPQTPEYTLRLTLTALLRAARDFNAQNVDQIRRVGVLPENLGLNRLEPVTAFDIIREVCKCESPGDRK